MKKLILPLLAVTILVGCSEDDTAATEVNTTFNDGYFIVNEGNFQSANASISHISADFNKLTNDVFKQANNRTIGDVAQSIVTNEKYAFVLVNNSNTIEVVDKKTMKSVHTITEGVATPKFAVIKNNKLYVTSLYEAEVAVYNVETFAFIKKIALNKSSEYIVATNDYIYAANGFYSGGKLVEVIDLATDMNTVDIPFDNAINGLTISGNHVYVLETNDVGSKIAAINNTSITTSIQIAQANARYLVADGSQLYYTASTGIYKLSTSLTSAAEKLFDVPSNDFSTLYGFNVFNGTIFTSDANGFTDKGKVTLYKEDGTKIKDFTVGIGPCGFAKF